MFSSKKLIKSIVTLTLVTLIAACGSTPQPTVDLNTNIFAKPDLKIGVVYTAPKEKATTHIYGAGCLLCYGVASALTSSLDKHLESTVTTDELTKIQELVVSEYSTKTKNVKIVTLPQQISKLGKFKGELGFAKKDFRPLKEQLGVDVLVVLDLYRHGAYRSFSNYIPNGDPQGYVSGLLYGVDLNTNAYIQYLKIDEQVQPQGEWDEPPTFPSVTTSYYQAVENIKSKLEQAI